MRRLVSSGSPVEADIGYSRAVVDGDWVFVSGTSGYDYATMTIADDIVEQTAQCLRNIARALDEAGCGFDEVVRVRYLVPQASEFAQCWPALRGTPPQTLTREAFVSSRRDALAALHTHHLAGNVEVVLNDTDRSRASATVSMAIDRHDSKGGSFSTRCLYRFGLSKSLPDGLQGIGATAATSTIAAREVTAATAATVAIEAYEATDVTHACGRWTIDSIVQQVLWNDGDPAIHAGVHDPDSSKVD